MKAPTADGLLLVDKPGGITSHAAAERARQILETRRVGHAGTLDPLATGVLILLVGRATRLVSFLDNEPKHYHARICFGTRTTTDDVEGDVMVEAPPPPQDVVERAIASLTGHLLQRPPAFSAKRVKGERAYAAARRGQPLVLEPVAVNVEEWRIIQRVGAEIEVEIVCSGGTYVRALARDLGEATGSAAHLAALRRLRSGRYDVRDATTMEALERGEFQLLTPADALAHMPRQSLDDFDARRVGHGQNVSASTPGDLAALFHDEQLVAVAVRDGESWRPRVVMRDA
ncbi:MAG: tRNA pseudouridine(55) synthase TruB [Deltaproteobacteria bacterium]|nr:MAG: tRNA pseudouridine(55) synthase TruB [Deltaproteobacteria bacterium]